jgi:uncharacterized protein YqeY
MTLKEKLQSDLTQAVKSGDSLKLSVLRMASAAIHNKEIEKRTKLSKSGEVSPDELEKQSRLNDEEALEVLVSETKKRKEAAAEYDKGGRQDLAEKEKAELEILQGYLPEELSDEELRKIAIEAVKASGAQTQKDFGKAMSALMSEIKGRAHGARAGQIIRELLG